MQAPLLVTAERQVGKPSSCLTCTFNWVSSEFTILKEYEHSRSELAFFMALVKDSTPSIMRTTKVVGSASFSFTLSKSLCTSFPLFPNHCK